MEGRIRSLEAQLATVQYQVQQLGVFKEAAEQKAATVEAKTQQETINPTVDEQALQAEADAEEEAIRAEIEAMKAERGEAPEYDPLNDAPVTNFTPEQLRGTPVAPEDAINAYLELQKTLSPAALNILNKLEVAFGNTEPSFQMTINAFRDMVNLGHIEEGEVTDAFLKLKGYLKAKAAIMTAPAATTGTDAAAEAVELEVAKEAATAAETITTAEIPVAINDGQVETLINEAFFTSEGLANSYWEQSAKTTNATKANSSELLYITIPKGDRIMLRNKTVDNAPVLDPTANKDRMIPGVIQIGDEVLLRIDTKWHGLINNDHEIDIDEDLDDEGVADSINNYLDDKGKIKPNNSDHYGGYANVPIEIIHKKTGKRIGYLPRNSWINATGGAGTYRNVEDAFPPGPDGSRATGNVAAESILNMRIRKRMADMFNANPGAEMSTRVTERTNGRIMYAGELTESTGRVAYNTRLAKTNLPDKSLVFGVTSREGAMMIGKSVPAASRMELVDLTPEQLRNLKGSPVVFIPLPNGKFHPMPLHTTKFDKRQGEVNTMLMVMEAYLQEGTPFETAESKQRLKDVSDATGFDVSTEEGLRDFTQQYYLYTSNFEDSLVRADATVVEGEGKVQRFLIAMPKSTGTDGRKALIKVGTSYSGGLVQYAQLGTDGKLKPKFVEAFTAGVATRYKNVAVTDGNIKGINNTNGLTEIRIDKNGKFSKVATHATYNDYLKSFVSTSVYGGHQVNGSDGKSHYVYAANSQVILNSSLLLSSELNATELMSAPAPTGKALVAEETEDFDIAEGYGDLFNHNISFNEPSRNIIQPQGDLLNLENLVELHRFTPEGQRNKQTPEAVLAHLQSLGITRIADGFNPFIKCS